MSTNKQGWCATRCSEGSDTRLENSIRFLAGDVESVLYQHFYDRIHDSVSTKFLRTLFTSLVAEDGDHLLEGYLYKLGGTLMSNWPRKYFHLFPNRLEWRGEQAGVSFVFPMKVSGGHAHGSQGGNHLKQQSELSLRAESH